MGIKVLAARRQRVDRLLRRRRRRHPLRPGRGAQRRRATSSRASARRARARGASSRSTTSCSKVPIHAANKRTVESLIKAGAFDSLGAHPPRARRGARGRGRVGGQDQAQRGERRGRLRLRQPLGRRRAARPQHHIPERPEWAKRDKLAFEREMLGLYVSDHPLAGLELPLAKLASTGIADLVGSENIQDGETVTIAGLVTSVQHRVAQGVGQPVRHDHRSRTSAARSPSCSWARPTRSSRPRCTGDSIVVVRGRVSMRDDGMNLHAFSLMTPDLGPGVRHRAARDHHARPAGDDRHGEGAERGARAAPGRERGAPAAGQGPGRARVRGAEAGARSAPTSTAS